MTTYKLVFLRLEHLASEGRGGRLARSVEEEEEEEEVSAAALMAGDFLAKRDAAAAAENEKIKKKSPTEFQKVSKTILTARAQDV